jgi:hypothetical protein
MDKEFIKHQVIKQSDNIMLSATNISTDSALPQQSEIIKIIESMKKNIDSYEKARNVSFSNEVLIYAIQETIAKNEEYGTNIKIEDILERAAYLCENNAREKPEELRKAIDVFEQLIDLYNRAHFVNERRILEAKIRDHTIEWTPKLKQWEEDKNKITIQDIDHALDYIVNKSK